MSEDLEAGTTNRQPSDISIMSGLYWRKRMNVVSGKGCTVTHGVEAMLPFHKVRLHLRFLLKGNGLM